MINTLKSIVLFCVKWVHGDPLKTLVSAQKEMPKNTKKKAVKKRKRKKVTQVSSTQVSSTRVSSTTKKKAKK
jgi:hypothetical protein